MRAEDLRDLFGLHPSEELYGCYLCAHTRPRWGSQFLQGQLYVFSSCMVFHANLIAVVKVVRIQFKDVRVIRKRSFLRLPNTIAVERFDASGGWHDDVFTSFVFSTRRRAYLTMVARWRANNPMVADAYLGPDLPPLDDAHDTEGGTEGGTGAQPAATAAAAAGAGVAGAVVPPGHHHHQQQQQHPERPFPCSLSQLQVPRDMLPVRPPDVAMTLVGSCDLPGDTDSLAQVLLSNTSGFLPHTMASQGNQLLSLTPWQMVPHQPGSSQPVRHLSRSFSYLYSTSGPWGLVRSRVLQRQTLTVGEDGRLVMAATQSMPDLPAGIGKCFNVVIRWELTPLASTAAASAAAGHMDTTTDATDASSSSSSPTACAGAIGDAHAAPTAATPSGWGPPHFAAEGPGAAAAATMADSEQQQHQHQHQQPPEAPLSPDLAQRLSPFAPAAAGGGDGDDGEVQCAAGGGFMALQGGAVAAGEAAGRHTPAAPAAAAGAGGASSHPRHDAAPSTCGSASSGAFGPPGPGATSSTWQRCGAVWRRVWRGRVRG